MRELRAARPPPCAHADQARPAQHTPGLKFVLSCLTCLLSVTTCLAPSFYAIWGSFSPFSVIDKERGGLL